MSAGESSGVVAVGTAEAGEFALQAAIASDARGFGLRGRGRERDGGEREEGGNGCRGLGGWCLGWGLRARHHGLVGSFVVWFVGCEVGLPTYLDLGSKRCSA